MYIYLTNAKKTGIGLLIMSKIAVYIDSINISCITITGDFNADISKKSVFENTFLGFCREYSLAICDQDNLPVDTHTC